VAFAFARHCLSKMPVTQKKLVVKDQWYSYGNDKQNRHHESPKQNAQPSLDSPAA